MDSYFLKEFSLLPIYIYMHLHISQRKGNILDENGCTP